MVSSSAWNGIPEHFQTDVSRCVPQNRPVLRDGRDQWNF
jgi:hypothetical protein